MLTNHRILIPNLLVGILLIIGALVFANDARTIIDAEESEEDFSKVLVISGAYMSSLQQLQIAQHEVMLFGDAPQLERYRTEKIRCINGLGSLRGIVAKEVPHSVATMTAVEFLQTEYLNDLELSLNTFKQQGPATLRSTLKGQRGAANLLRMQVLLDQIESDVNVAREALNERVAFSIKRARASFAGVAALLILILGLGYRITTRALAANQRLTVRLEHEATHDALTQLPNRRFFLDWIHRTVAVAARNRFAVALYFIDLDGFKLVNDTHGHDAGDEVLRVTAHRFQSLMRESDLLVRLGGDEFAVLVTNAPGEEQLSALAARLIDALKEPIMVANFPECIGASIGIAMFPQDARDANDLITAADDAMYQAKQSGKGRYCFFKAATSATA